MEHHLKIDNLGPIKHCSLDVSNYMVLTGYQASGKSTVAKAIYFFRSVKEDITTVLTKRFQSQDISISLEDTLRHYLMEKLYRTFGVAAMSVPGMKLSYSYAPDVWIHISIGEKRKNCRFSPYLKESLSSLDNQSRNNTVHSKLSDVNSFSDYIAQKNKELGHIFNDSYETIYIPAGRSILTLLSSQWNYLYSTMDDAQKSLFDECTRDYIENVLLLKSLYAHDYERKVLDTLTDAHLRELSKKADELRNTILKGHYLCENGTERIELANNSKVDLNFASSGQQEVVWVLNFLYMRLVTHRPSYFIIEEPESNLFPASQKYVTELISLVVNAGHAALVTTHSPYVLGTMNNLLYAYSLPKSKQKDADSILSKDCWIDSTDFRAYFVEDGTISDCIDHEINQIDSSKMDAISSVVNEEYDRLSMLTWDSEGKDV